MSKYFNDGIAPVSFIAGEDLTTWQYLAVRLVASGGFKVSKCTTASQPVAFGILQNDPSSGQEATVKCLGFTKAYAHVTSTSALYPGNLLMVASDGALEAVGATTCVVVARWADEARTTTGSHLGNVLFYAIQSDASGRAY
jgi:hypothetical protein